jgi:hypothetical protein
MCTVLAQVARAFVGLQEGFDVKESESYIELYWIAKDIMGTVREV